MLGEQLRRVWRLVWFLFWPYQSQQWWPLWVSLMKDLNWYLVAGMNKNGLISSFTLYFIGTFLTCSATASLGSLTTLSEERMVFQTDYGTIEMAFYHKVIGFQSRISSASETNVLIRSCKIGFNGALVCSSKSVPFAGGPKDCTTHPGSSKTWRIQY